MNRHQTWVETNRANVKTTRMEAREEMKAQGRLNRAFTAMRMAGLIAEQNLCDCQAGCYCMEEEGGERIAAGWMVKGCVFYHAEARDEKQAGNNFYLTAGRFETDEGEIVITRDQDVATLVMAICQEHGVKVEWDGDLDHRIVVKWAAMLRENETEVAIVGVKTRRRKV